MRTLGVNRTGMRLRAVRSEFVLFTAISHPLDPRERSEREHPLFYNLRGT
jgi:hypothetical protein